MKKVILLFCMAMSLFATNVFAQMQEVRGVETRRVVYTGNHYYNGYVWCSNSEMYGWEFHNANSIKVSVDIELYYTDSKGVEHAVATKSVVLAPDEAYVLKQESNDAHCKKHGNTDYGSMYNINSYNVRYKAYKLQ